MGGETCAVDLLIDTMLMNTMHLLSWVTVHLGYGTHTWGPSRDLHGNRTGTKYRLDAEAKGSTVFRIPEDVYKTRGR